MTPTWTIRGDGWVEGSIFGFDVEHNEVKRPGGAAYYVVDETSTLGNLHTSEGYDVDALIGTLKSKGFAGQWCVGESRIIQTRPVWAQGSLLLGGEATNHWTRMQVEQVAFSKLYLWAPANPTFDPMAALAAFYAIEFGVPLKTPVSTWKDDASDVPPDGTSNKLYGPNPRRAQAASIGLSNLTGWIHHCEVPLNEHFDCGAYNRTALFQAAQLLVDSLEVDMTPEQAAQQARIETKLDEVLGWIRTVNAQNIAGELRGVGDGYAHPDGPSEELRKAGLGSWEADGWKRGSDARKAIDAIPDPPEGVQA